MQSANGALVPLIPLVLVAPKYLSGALTLGAVMQLTAAFVSVQIAFNWFIDNSVRVAEWMASAHRVDELAEALESSGYRRHHGGERVHRFRRQRRRHDSS